MADLNKEKNGIEANGSTNGSAQKKQWIMNAFSMSSPGHVAAGLWSHPKNRTAEYTDIEYWTDLAKILEAGKFHGLFIADMLGIYDLYKGPGNIDSALPGAAQFPISDPLMPIAAMAAVTKHLSFGVTASTTYEPPFLLARKYSTLDHLTKGRIAWNVVTSYLESAARNLNLDTQIPHDERYVIAEEYLQVTLKLWESSWKDDAVVKDAKKGIFTVPGRVRRIDHEGKYFKVAGPFTNEPSIQRSPFIFQAGASPAGKAFATKYAECMFLTGFEPHTVREQVDDIRALAAKNGRGPGTPKLIIGMLIIVDETDEKARAKYEEYMSYADLEGSLVLAAGWTGTDFGQFSDDEDLRFTGTPGIQSMVNCWSATVPGTNGARWTKKRVAEELAVGGPLPKAIGSPKTVADILQTWVDESGVDGFNIPYAINPGDFEDIIKWLWPELRRRGVFWDDYPAATTRENYYADGKGSRLRDDHPGSAFKWH